MLSALYTTEPWSNLYMNVIVRGRLTLQISCENFLELLLFECVTQFYLTKLKKINRNLKFISYPFEVCIKILESWQAWTTDLQEI